MPIDRNCLLALAAIRTQAAHTHSRCRKGISGRVASAAGDEAPRRAVPRVRASHIAKAASHASDELNSGIYYLPVVVLGCAWLLRLKRRGAECHVAGHRTSF